VGLVDQVGRGPGCGGQRLVEGLLAGQLLDQDGEVLDAGFADAADQLGDVLAALREGSGEGLGPNQGGQQLGEALDAECRQMGRQLLEVIRCAFVGVEDPIVTDQVVEQVVGGAQLFVPAEAAGLARLDEVRPERLSAARRQVPPDALDLANGLHDLGGVRDHHDPRRQEVALLDMGIMRLGELHRSLMTVLHTGGEALARDQGDHGLADDARGQKQGGQLLLNAPRLPAQHDEARVGILLEHHQGVEKAQARVAVSADGPGQARSDPRGSRFFDDVEDDRTAAPDDADPARRAEQLGGHVAELEEVGAAFALLDDHDARRVGADAGHPVLLQNVHRPARLLVAHVLGHEKHEPRLLRAVEAVAGGLQRVRGRGVVEHDVDIAALLHRLLDRGEDRFGGKVRIGVPDGARRHRPADVNAELHHRIHLEAGRPAKAENADARLLPVAEDVLEGPLGGQPGVRIQRDPQV